MVIIDLPAVASPRFAGWDKFLASIKTGAIISALIIASVLAVWGTTIQRECSGAFSLSFSTGFDRYRCKLKISHVATNMKVTIPLPDWALPQSASIR